MLRLYLYGCLHRVQSSRCLEVGGYTHSRIERAAAGLRPGFKIIADFRRDNRSAIKAVFLAFVVLCRKLDLFGCELLGVDVTRLKAVDSDPCNFTKVKLAKYIKSAGDMRRAYFGYI